MIYLERQIWLFWQYSCWCRGALINGSSAGFWMVACFICPLRFRCCVWGFIGRRVYLMRHFWCLNPCICLIFWRAWTCIFLRRSANQLLILRIVFGGGAPLLFVFASRWLHVFGGLCCRARNRMHSQLRRHAARIRPTLWAWAVFLNVVIVLL